MTKKILTFAILFIVLAGVFAPVKALATDCAWVFSGACTIGNQQCTKPLVGPVTCTTASGTQANPVTETAKFSETSGGIWEQIATGVGQFLMMISSFVLIFSGMIFDWVLKFTIVDMAQNIGGTTGVGASITTAWATLRDIANMCFIFVLLYAAFKTMFDANFGNFQTTIKNIIIVALLINFSLFFSKVVIDASNIVAVGFYNSITVNSYPISGNKLIAGGATVTGTKKSISGGYMKMLGVNTFYGSDILKGQIDAKNILLVGVMSSVFMLIVAVILLIAGIMFAARFIILIFLMILSPLALIAFIIPGMNGQFTKWREALVDQSFFAPIYFALTWVVFKLGTSLLATIKVDPDLGTQNPNFANMFNSPGGAVSLIVNYVLIIGFSIAALIFAKSMASKTAGFKQISGGIGTAAIGTGAWAGRQSLGRVAGRLEKSAWFQGKAARNPKTFGALYTGTQKAARGSFDVRGVDTLKKVPGLGSELDIMGKAGGVGGFEKYKEDKTKRVIDKGKQFTDRRARADYARRIGSKIGTHQGSTPNNIPSLFGSLGRSNRIAAATLLDERIKELGTGIGSARSELNGYLNQMGITGPGLPPAPTIANLRGIAAPTAIQRGMLSAHEQRRFDDLIEDAINPATGLTRDSIDGLNTELTNTRGDRTTLGLTNTLRQQF